MQKQTFIELEDMLKKDGHGHESVFYINIIFVR